MNTDDLIRALSADPTPARGLRARLLAGLIPALCMALLAVWVVLGFRDDLVASLLVPLSATRFVLTGALALIGLRLVLLLARPGGDSRAHFWPFAVVGAVALALWIRTYATTPADARQMAVIGKTIWYCLICIPVLAILPVASILAMVRHGATTVPRLASAVAGLAGSGAAAAVYALHCTEDNPLFYVTWYGLAIGVVTLATTLIGPRLLRW